MGYGVSRVHTCLKPTKDQLVPTKAIGICQRLHTPSHRLVERRPHSVGRRHARNLPVHHHLRIWRISKHGLIGHFQRLGFTTRSSSDGSTRLWP